MRRFLLAALFVAAAAASRAGEIVIVAPNSPSSPYAEALQGICESLGKCPTVLAAGDDLEIPADARVVIALGGRAARLDYPARTVLVTALSPGYEARARPDSGPIVRVRLTFAPEVFVRRLMALKPGGKKLALLWSDPASGRFAESVRAVGAAAGLTVNPVRVSDPAAIPALLRGLPPADALWLAPDSALVTPMVFDAACEYARSAGLAFYAPVPALAARGGAAGLAPDFHSAGLRAGEAAREALAGNPLAMAKEAYPTTASEPLADIVASTKTIRTP